MIYGSRGGEDVSGLVQSYCPLRVFNFLNLSPSAASILYGLGGGADTRALNTGPVIQTQTDCQTDMMGTVSEVGGLLAQNNSDTVKKNKKNSILKKTNILKLKY